MKNEGNIDFRATTTSRPSSGVEMNRRGGFSSSPPHWGGFRWGFSSTAQFMQADNYIQTPEDYIGYNRYAYCRYNPFKYVDPSGEMLMYSPGPSDGTCYETANPIIYYSRNDELQAEINAEKAEELASSGGDDGVGGENVTPPAENKDTKADGDTETGNVSGKVVKNSDETANNDSKGEDANKDNDENKDGVEPYEQKKIEYDKNGEPIIPYDAKAVNTNNSKAYYKPAHGYYDKNFYIKPGYYITGPIDGLSTNYRNNMVYKVPDLQHAIILENGNVMLLPNVVSSCVLMVNQAFYLGNYEYGWLGRSYFQKQGVYNDQWDGLFPGQRTGGKK